MNKNPVDGKTFGSALKLIHLISVISVGGAFLCMLFILLRKNGIAYDGTEVILDKILLLIFNTAVVYGAILMALTAFIYGGFTKWGFIRFHFLIMKWIIASLIFLVAWFFLGSAVSGMASISDAGLHMESLSSQYRRYTNQTLISLVVELGLLTIAMYISIKRPFGKRNTKPFVHRKVVGAIVALFLLSGLILTIMGEVRLKKLRETSVADIDVDLLADGTYFGQANFGNYTYKVKVIINNHEIITIEDIAPRDSIYVTYATGVFKKIIERQTPNVDAVSGATTTSKAFMKAVENALE